ncbi:MAG TPA: hypothetical protein GXX17_08295 [Clostridiales bacterium]|nr:hypothetical protein [Clostridiales bacterium]
MSDLNQHPMFFLGANSSRGYMSFYENAYDPSDGWCAYIIKGGFGAGKSLFFKRIAKSLIERGHCVELIVSPYSPQSLDAIIIPEKKIAILDAAPPHNVEPDLPGVSGLIVNLTDCLDVSVLHGKDAEILRLFKESQLLKERGLRYIEAAGTLANDSYQIALECTDTLKASRFAHNLAKRLIPRSKINKPHEWKRFLSSITPLGLVYFRSTLDKLCDEIIVISDEHGAAAKILMSTIRKHALDMGYEIYTCLCSLLPEQKIEHIIIPELSIAFCNTNRYIQYEECDRRIHARRFTDAALIRQKKQRLTFNRRAIKELLEGSAELFAEAKKYDDEIDKYYNKAWNLEKMAEISNRIIEHITK